MLSKEEKQAARLNELLFTIHNILDELEQVDPYGDVIENFQDPDGKRVTKRLMEMVIQDIEEGYWTK